MTRMILILFCFLFRLPAAEKDWVDSTIDLTINNKFDEAKEIIDHRLTNGDSSVKVYFYYASILNSELTHFEFQIDDEQFLQVLDTVIEKANRQFETAAPGDSTRLARLCFYRGNAAGYKAYHLGRKGSWYSAFDHGLQAIGDLNRAVEYDSTLFDAYLGIGAYKYWSSTKLKYLLWIPFIPDQRDEGIKYLKKAIQDGAHGKYMGMHQLIYILLDYDKFEEALGYARAVVEAYPESQFMWWANAHTYYKMHDYPEAVRSYKKLLALIGRDNTSNPMHWLTCQVRLAEIYKKMNNPKHCRSHCLKALGRDFGGQLTDKGRDKLKQAREMYQWTESFGE